MSNRMTAGEICRRDVAVATPSTGLDEAARTMRSHHVGCLVVVEDGDDARAVVGLLTDRDIVTTIVARDVAPTMLCVGDVMTREVVSALKDDALHDVLSRMRRHRVRRLPVVGARQHLVGVVTADDVLRVLADELHTLAQVPHAQIRQEQSARP